ncbi:hypothetical protein E2C01_030436 [Portunus trituberculatus]|uniref:Secreted peptide n=1 Tax=Portunus trituberculatus TaxID=210409 RepID=A0A5B7EXA9_PORTR|nr:hypothetical protein [Portunus trituberculatus]
MTVIVIVIVNIRLCILSGMQVPGVCCCFCDSDSIPGSAVAGMPATGGGGDLLDEEGIFHGLRTVRRAILNYLLFLI